MLSFTRVYCGRFSVPARSASINGLVCIGVPGSAVSPGTVLVHFAHVSCGRPSSWPVFQRRVDDESPRSPTSISSVPWFSGKERKANKRYKWSPLFGLADAGYLLRPLPPSGKSGPLAQWTLSYAVETSGLAPRETAAFVVSRRCSNMGREARK